MARRRLRQVTDLYVVGKVETLADNSPVWVQVLNPFETDTARSEGLIAKARITLALKEFGSDEQAKVRMFFFEDGLDSARDMLVDARVAECAPKILDRIQNDAEWNERLLIMERGLDDTATTPEGEEYELLEKISTEYAEELNRRIIEERDFQQVRYSNAAEELLWSEYLDWYMTRRGSELMLAEYKVHQVLFGARWCYATQRETGLWDHAECAGHQERMFADKEEVRSAPAELVALLMAAVNDVEMTVREAKNSDRQGSSDVSSPLPSEVEASTVSTPIETPASPRGSSSSPSTTPSPSLVSTS